MLFTSKPGRAAVRRDAVDEQMIDRMAQGDRAALQALYANSHTAVYSFALSILRHAQDAEDVMQDTYLRAAANAARYQPMGKPMAWLLTITRNLALMRLRERSRDAGPDLDDVACRYAAPDSLPIEDKLLLRQALGALDDVERQVIALHATSGLKHREVAALLDLPLSTVLSKYNRALRKLKTMLEEGWEA